MAVGAIVSVAARALPAIAGMVNSPKKETSPGSPSKALGSQFTGVSGTISLTGPTSVSTPGGT